MFENRKRTKGQFASEPEKIKKSTCLICNKLFTYYPNCRIEKYCSHDCYYKSQIGVKRPQQSVFLKEYHKKNPGFSKSFLGKHHSLEAKKKTGEGIAKKWKDKNSGYNSKEFRQKLSDEGVKRNRFGKLNNGHSHGNTGWYVIGDKEYYFRSDWEVLYARYLEWLINRKEIKEWQYEVEVFWFLKIKRGIRSYKPDFKITNNDEGFEYHEVKGWMDNKSKTKVKRMAKYYPNVTLKVIGKTEYNQLKKIERMFPEAKKVTKN